MKLVFKSKEDADNIFCLFSSHDEKIEWQVTLWNVVADYVRTQMTRRKEISDFMVRKYKILKIKDFAHCFAINIILLIFDGWVKIDKGRKMAKSR